MGRYSALVDPLVLYVLAYPTLMYSTFRALEVWSQDRGACGIFEFVWCVSVFVRVVAPGLRVPMCVAPLLRMRYSILFDLWHI